MIDNGKREKCYEIFNRYKEVSKKIEHMAFSINHLKSSVQNPDFITKEDFKIVAESNAIVLKNLEIDFSKCYGELLDLYREVAEIYDVKFEDYE